MSPYIRVVRVPYEEPYHLHLMFEASNGRVRGALELYLEANDLLRWADGMETFPMHSGSDLRWELGSECAEDRWAYHFLMRVLTVNGRGNSAIHFRFNNNEELPFCELTELCIVSEPAAINRLGQLFRNFSDLEHEVLEWSPTSGGLFRSTDDAELAHALRQS